MVEEKVDVETKVLKDCVICSIVEDFICNYDISRK